MNYYNNYYMSLLSIISLHMNFLARAISGGSRLIARAAPASRFIARNLPGALNTAARFSTNPAVQAAVQQIGGNKGTSVLNNLAGGVSNVQAGLQLVPGVVSDARNAYGAASNAYSQAKPVVNSLARLMQTTRGATG